MEKESGVKQGKSELVYNKASENLIEIVLAFASLQLRNKNLGDTDSITWKQMFVEWANEFESVHAGTDWNQDDYLEEIEKYARKKIMAYAGLEECPKYNK